MEYKHTFSLMFFVRKERKNREGKTPIYLRISVNGKKAEISLKQYVDIKAWDAKAYKVKGRGNEAKEINAYLDHVKVKINQYYRTLNEKGKAITAKVLKNKFLGVDERRKTLIEVFEYHNKMMKEEVGKTYAPATYKRFSTTLRHTVDFMKYQYHRDDLTLDEIDYSFITNFEHYFKAIRNCNHNTTAKYLKNIRKIIYLAVNNDWLDKDPFGKYKITFKETKRQYLDQEELDKIQNHTFNTQRLEIVKDIFVFSCYTGLAYVDIAKLTKYNVRKGINGKPWIFTDRTKTKNECRIPLFPQAETLIERYSEFPSVADSDKLFPVLSNQKMNAYLKEIADVCGIQKNLTFHMARHTFATTITLYNGMSIESVRLMLGHRKISTTQIYAKTKDQRVSDDYDIAIENIIKKRSYEKRKSI